MKILVTGAGGFLGRALTGYLADLGHDVVAVDNNSRGALSTLPPHERIKTVLCDVLDFGHLFELTQGVDAIYHLAYINGTRYFYSIPEKILEIGIIGTHNILKAALQHKVPRFYLASSSEVYQYAAVIPTPEEIECRVPDVLNPRYSYGGGKIACELLTVNYLRNTSIQYSIFRPHNVYGPQMGHEHVLPDLIRKIYERTGGNIRENQKIDIEIQGTGRETRSFIYVDDAVRAIEAITLNIEGTGIYHVGTEAEISIFDLVQLLGKILNINIIVTPSVLQMGSTSRRCPNTNKIREKGFVPKVPLEEGLKKTIDWYWSDLSHQSQIRE